MDTHPFSSVKSSISTDDDESMEKIRPLPLFDEANPSV
jgi:hypothetical protein